MHQLTYQDQGLRMLMTGHRQVPVEKLSGVAVTLLMPMDASVVFEVSTCLVIAKCMWYSHSLCAHCAQGFLMD